ncbi:hypothetical protein HK102_010277 [Quaeritorhiza haematococci]|nr:hypothetical protein HK102_010277 [Quaeritorhiza haematococci]
MSDLTAQEEQLRRIFDYFCREALSTPWNIVTAVSIHQQSTLLEYIVRKWPEIVGDKQVKFRTGFLLSLVGISRKNLRPDMRLQADQLFREAQKDPNELVRAVAFLAKDWMSGGGFDLALEDVSPIFKDALERLRPHLINKDLKICPADLVYLSDRVVDSIKLRGYESIKEIEPSSRIHVRKDHAIPPENERLKKYRKAGGPSTTATPARSASAGGSFLRKSKPTSFLRSSKPAGISTEKRFSFSGASSAGPSSAGSTHKGFVKESKIRVLDLEETQNIVKSKQEQERLEKEEKEKEQQRKREEAEQRKRQREKEAEEKKAKKMKLEEKKKQTREAKEAEKKTRETRKRRTTDSDVSDHTKSVDDSSMVKEESKSMTDMSPSSPVSNMDLTGNMRRSPSPVPHMDMGTTVVGSQQPELAFANPFPVAPAPPPTAPAASNSVAVAPPPLAPLSSSPPVAAAPPASSPDHFSAIFGSETNCLGPEDRLLILDFLRGQYTRHASHKEIKMNESVLYDAVQNVNIHESLWIHIDYANCKWKKIRRKTKQPVPRSPHLGQPIR